MIQLRSVRHLLLGALVALGACGGADRPPEQGDGGAAAPVAVPETPAQETPAPTALPSDAALGGPSSLDAADAGVPSPSARPSDQITASPAPGGVADEPAATQRPAPTGTAANDILERAEETYAQLRTMEADFVQEVYVPLLETTKNSRGKIYHRSPDRFLMRFTDPAGDIVVADGRYIWMYYPSSDDRQVMRAALSASGQQVDLHREFLSNATERFNATRTGGETIGGRQTHALTLVPRSQSPYRLVRLWIDAQDNLVRRFEITEENGTVRKLEMQNLRPNASLPDDLFVFTAPPGVEVHDF